MVNITAPHNLDAFNNATDFYGMTVASNNISGGYFGIFIVLITIFLVFVVMRGYDTKTVLLASTTFGWLVALLLFTPLELIGANIFSAISAIAIGAILISAFNKD